MLSSYFPILVASASAVGAPAAKPVCAEAIQIEAKATDAGRLRALLREGSLATLTSEACSDIRVTLREEARGDWLLSMTSRRSKDKLERQVTSLKHAATWIEAWSQSGFVAATAEPAQPRGPSASRALSPPRIASESAVVPVQSTQGASGSDERLFVGAGPMSAMTSRGDLLAGLSLRLGSTLTKSPWILAEFGAMSQIAANELAFRRAFWAGPGMGVSFPITTHLFVLPAVGVGVLGAHAQKSTTSTSLGAYASLECSLIWNFTSHWGLFAGVEGRALFPTLFGTSSGATLVSSSTDEEDDETVVVSASPSSNEAQFGQIWGALRLGLVFQFGERS